MKAKDIDKNLIGTQVRVTANKGTLIFAELTSIGTDEEWIRVDDWLGINLSNIKCIDPNAM